MITEYKSLIGLYLLITIFLSIMMSQFLINDQLHIGIMLIGLIIILTMIMVVIIL